MRDHMKLRVFELADELALIIYQATKRFSWTRDVSIDFANENSRGFWFHPIPALRDRRMCERTSGRICSSRMAGIAFWKAKGITLSVQPCQTAGILQRV